MLTAADLLARLETLGAIAVIRIREARRLRAVVDALVEGGVLAVEVTMTVPGATDLIRDLARTPPSGCVIGAGTVTDSDTARAVVDAGARFVVSPIFRQTIVDVCRQLDVPAIPGCFTPTEMFDAYEGGAGALKLFPATALGPQFIKDVRVPLPALKLIPTGGVTIENAGEWIRAGAIAVGIGSGLVDNALIERGDFRALADRARRLVGHVAAARDGR